MLFDGGELALLLVSILVLLVAAGLYVIAYRNRDDYNDLGFFSCLGGIFATIIGVVLIISSFGSAAAHGATVRARHDLERQGFSVVNVDLSLGGGATVLGPDNCKVLLRVEKTDVGDYVVYNSKRIIREPNTVSCDM